MDTTTDQTYIDKVLQGDTNAFSYLINKYKNMAFTIAIKIVKNSEDAEEVAQDSFLRPIKNWIPLRESRNFQLGCIPSFTEMRYQKFVKRKLL